MPSPQRRVFKSTQDWHEFFAELIIKRQTGELNDQQVGEIINDLRQNVYKEIQVIRQRPLFVYASNFLAPLPREAQTSIGLDDVDGFTDLVNSVDSKFTTVDVLLHSPGGSPDATERIVTILRNRFKEVHFLVPHSAYSAATMLALSGDSIVLHNSATLGPIDPQIEGIPARSIKRGFEKVEKKLSEEGPESLPAYIPLLEKYTIHLLEICEDSAKLSEELVTQWLMKYMFSGKKAKTKIERAVKFFSNYDNHMIHSRPLTFNRIKDLELNIALADNHLGGLLWETYILLNGFFTTTPFVKLYESSDGVSWGRQFHQFIIPTQAPQSITPI